MKKYYIATSGMVLQIVADCLIICFVCVVFAIIIDLLLLLFLPVLLGLLALLVFTKVQRLFYYTYVYIADEEKVVLNSFATKAQIKKIKPGDIKDIAILKYNEFFSWGKSNTNIIAIILDKEEPVYNKIPGNPVLPGDLRPDYIVFRFDKANYIFAKSLVFAPIKCKDKKIIQKLNRWDDLKEKA